LNSKETTWGPKLKVEGVKKNPQNDDHLVQQHIAFDFMQNTQIYRILLLICFAFNIIFEKGLKKTIPFLVMV
jgi:hypothetical protein